MKTFLTQLKIILLYALGYVFIYGAVKEFSISNFFLVTIGGFILSLTGAYQYKKF